MCTCTHTYVRIYMYLCAMQHAATHCIAPKHTTATHYNTPQHAYLCAMSGKNHNPIESIFMCKSQIQKTQVPHPPHNRCARAQHTSSHYTCSQCNTHHTPLLHSAPPSLHVRNSATQSFLLSNTHTATHCALTATHSTLKCFTVQPTRYPQVRESVTHSVSLPNADTPCTSVHSSATHSLRSAQHSSSLHMPTLQHTPHCVLNTATH